MFLTGNPQVTFFKQLYKRHTNFAIQSVESGFNGSVSWGSRVSMAVPRVGDLMSRVYLQATIPDLIAANPVDQEKIAWVRELGHFLINTVEVQIGGQIIDKHYGTWLSIWMHLTLDKGKEEGYNDMIGNVPELWLPNTDAKVSRELYIPLKFWFAKHEGLALPLIALQYHEVRFVVEFEKLANLIQLTQELETISPASSVTFSDAKLYIDYIFLDTDERRKFAQTSHEYLIDQLQFTGDESLPGVSTGIKLNFNHPCKEIIWVILSETRRNNQYALEDPLLNPLYDAKLQFNGHDRFAPRKGRYFNEVQPYQHHTNIPLSYGINLYSFALYPEMEQPSGTSNFSRIDSSILSITLVPEALDEDNVYIKVFASNFNILRILSGMGGLAYSN